MDQGRCDFQLYSRGQRSLEEQWDHCNREVTGFHQQAIAHLMAENEFEALRLWKDALKSINRATNRANDDSAAMSGSADVGGCDCEGTAVPYEDFGAVPSFISTIVVRSPNSNPKIALPNRVFLLETSLIFQDIFPAKRVNEALSAVVMYHIAVSLHRGGLLSGFQCLLQQSMDFYGLAHSILSRIKPDFSPAGLEEIYTNVLYNIRELSNSLETAPTA
jgi:hypothetical protein